MFTHLKSKAIKCIFTIISGNGRPIERWTFNYLNKVAMSAQKSQLEMRKNGIILEHTRDTNAHENRRIPRKTICCLNVSENSRCFIAILFPFGSIVWIGRCWKDAMKPLIGYNHRDGSVHFCPYRVPCIAFVHSIYCLYCAFLCFYIVCD